MISSRQIKAARALLDWTQSKLAKNCGLHVNAINKIETDQNEPRVSTLERIKATFEEAGVRFRGTRGVEIKDETFEVVRFEGPDLMRRLMDDQLPFLRGPQDELLFCSPDDDCWTEADASEMKRYFRHMKKVGSCERGLVLKSTTTFLGDKKTYRWLPEGVIGIIAYVVYGNRVAFFRLPVREVLIVKSQPLADTYRAQFEFMWSKASPFD
jgi:transcriptional regulator with XRE-family HTH domain